MVSINRILCAVDFSTFSGDGVRHGLVLARWYSARLTLLHVYQAVPPIADLPGTAFLPLPSEDAIADEVRQFCAPFTNASDQTLDVVVREGRAAKEIAREADELPADLLILGTHGRSGFERLFLGSVTEKVLRSTRVPVLTVPPPVREAGAPLFKTILCPIDFSDASIRALEYALSLAQEADARLILLHVLEEGFDHVDADAMRDLSAWEYFEEIERKAADRLRKVVPRDAHLWARPEERITKGRPHQEILKAVTSEHADLVVMGVRGRSAVDQLVFGSTTHRVIREAGCPVLTLHSGPTAESASS